MELKKKSLVEQILNIALNVFIVFFGIILLITIYNSIQTKILKKSYADFFGYSVFEVQTGSMADAINAGDWIIVKKQKNFKLNDIVTYKYNNEFITHRIIESYNGTFVTKGDANNTKDDPIDEGQIVGKVVKILGNFGILKKTIFNPIVILVIIINIFVISKLLKNKDNTKKIEKTKETSLKISIPKVNVDKLKEKIKNSRKKLEKKTKKKEPIVKEEKVKEPEEEINNEIIDEEIVNEKPIENVEEDNTTEEVSQFIPVDISEIDDTLLEIADNEMKEKQEEEKKKEKIKEEPIKEEKIPTKINTEIFESNKLKKAKNVIDKIITIKVEELNELFNNIYPNKLSVNEPSIKNTLMGSYIDSRYYNYYGFEEYEYLKNSSSKIENYLKDISEKIKFNYKGTDTKYNDKVNNILNIFILINRLEHARDTISDLKAKTEYYKKEFSTYMKNNKVEIPNVNTLISDIMKIQRNYIGIREYFYKKLESPMFNLSLNKITRLKNAYGAMLEHNIAFSKVYSDYIIDKTYNEGTIAEDKIVILLTMLSAIVSKDMLKGTFNNKYLVGIPNSLLTKEKKIERTLKLIEDEYAKDNVIFLVDIKDFISKDLLIKKKVKSGYKFAVVISDTYDMNSKDYKTLLNATYIFVDKRIDNAVEMLKEFTGDLMGKVVYENILSKVGSFGDEE